MIWQAKNFCTQYYPSAVSYAHQFSQLNLNISALDPVTVVVLNTAGVPLYYADHKTLKASYGAAPCDTSIRPSVISVDCDETIIPTGMNLSQLPSFNSSVKCLLHPDSSGGQALPRKCVSLIIFATAAPQRFTLLKTDELHLNQS